MSNNAPSALENELDEADASPLPPSPPPPPKASNEITLTTWLSAICGCFAGFSYGYEPPLASGLVVIYSFVHAFFPEQLYHDDTKTAQVSPYCATTSVELTVYMACVFLTAALTSPFSGLIANKWGRRTAFLLGAWILLIANILQISAMNSAMIWTGRLILGVSMALLTTAAPVYIAEMSPAAYRGRFGAAFSLSTAIGQAVAFFVNQGVGASHNSNAWRISFACGTWSTIGMLILLHFFLPDTPSSLLYQGKFTKAEEEFNRIRSSAKHVSNRNEWNLMKGEAIRSMTTRKMLNGDSSTKKASWVNWSKIKKVFTIIPAFTTMFNLGFVRMWSGYVATMLFTSVLFKAAGLSTAFSLLAQSLIGVSTVLGSIVSILVFDKVGRRRSLIRSGILMTICIALSAVVLGVYLNPAPGSKLSYGAATGLLICLFFFQFFFYTAWGASYWVITSEVYPLAIRSSASGVGMTLSFTAAFISVLANARMLCSLQYGTFIFFACVDAYLTWFAYYLLLETKGLKLQEIENMWRTHKIWKRFVPKDKHVYDDDDNDSNDEEEQSGNSNNNGECGDPVQS